MNTYEIICEKDRILADIAQAGGEVTEEQESALEVNRENALSKAGGILKVMANLDGEIAARKAEEKRIADGRKTLENGKRRLKDLLAQCHECAGGGKLQVETWTVYKQKNPPRVVIDDVGALPMELTTVTVTVDKTAVKAALKVGPVSGAHMEQGESLRIK